MKKILKGIAASPGKARGKAKIVHSATDSSNFNKDEVLVAEKTDPTMVVMMSRASAIVTDTGGLTCHAAIVSREMGIPCVVATKTATKDIKNGDEILVDGTAGEVFLLSE